MYWRQCVHCDVGTKFLNIISFNFRPRRFLKCETFIATFAKHGTSSAIFILFNSAIYRPMKAGSMVMHVGSHYFVLLVLIIVVVAVGRVLVVVTVVVVVVVVAEVSLAILVVK